MRQSLVVKNQYFADRRDLFKYDLLLDLVESHGGARLTLIPMLTPDDGTREGQLTQVNRGERRVRLFEFLLASTAAGQRDVRRLRELFPQVGVSFMPYRDDAWFTHQGRGDYFSSVPLSFLSQSVVFIDPDVGLETKNRADMAKRGFEKYLFYSELKDVWRRLSAESLVVVYQHLQRNAHKRPGDVARRLQEMGSELEVSAAAVWHQDLAFLVAAKSGGLARTARAALVSHAERHGLCFAEAEWGSTHSAQDWSREFRPYVLRGERGRSASTPANRGAMVPTISRFFGIDIRIHWREHPPAHFHAIYGELEATFSIETLDLLEGRLPRRVMALVVEWAMIHRPELRENWRRAGQREPLVAIAGLDEES